MNEAETRADHIDPALKAAGWGWPKAAAFGEENASASGVKVRHTSPTKIREVVVAFPSSTDEQRKIVATLGKLSAPTQGLASLYQQNLAALYALKKSSSRFGDEVLD